MFNVLGVINVLAFKKQGNNSTEMK
jgi:hypothetical protein